MVIERQRGRRCAAQAHFAIDIGRSVARCLDAQFAAGNANVSCRRASTRRVGLHPVGTPILGTVVVRVGSRAELVTHGLGTTGIRGTAVAAAGLVPGAERDGAGQGAVVIRVRLEIESRVGIRRQQPRRGTAYAAERRPVGAIVRRVIPTAIGRVRRGHGNPQGSHVVDFGHVVNLAGGRGKVHKRRDQRAHGAGGCSGVFVDRREGRALGGIQHRCVVDRGHHQRGGIRGGGVGRRATRGRGIGQCAIRPIRLVPSTECDGVAHGTVVVRIGLKIEPRIRVRRQQPRRGTAHAAERRPGGTIVRRVIPTAIGRIGGGHRDPQGSAAVGVGHIVNLARGRGKVDERRNQRADGARRRSRVLVYGAERRTFRRIQDRRGVGRRQCIKRTRRPLIIVLRRHPARGAKDVGYTDLIERPVPPLVGAGPITKIEVKARFVGGRPGTDSPSGVRNLHAVAIDAWTVRGAVRGRNVLPLIERDRVVDPNGPRGRRGSIHQECQVVGAAVVDLQLFASGGAALVQNSSIVQAAHRPRIDPGAIRQRGQIIERRAAARVHDVVDAVDVQPLGDLGRDAVARRHAAARRPLVGVGRAVADLRGASPGVLLQVPDGLVVGVPDIDGILLVGSRRVAVIDVEHGVGGSGQRGHLDPGREGTTGGRIGLNLVAEFGRAVRAGEQDVVTTRQGIGGQVRVRGKIDQHRKIRKVRTAADLGVIDRDLFAIGPARVVPGQCRAGLLQQCEIQGYIQAFVQGLLRTERGHLEPPIATSARNVIRGEYTGVRQPRQTVNQ